MDGAAYPMQSDWSWDVVGKSTTRHHVPRSSFSSGNIVVIVLSCVFFLINAAGLLCVYRLGSKPGRTLHVHVSTVLKSYTKLVNSKDREDKGPSCIGVLKGDPIKGGEIQTGGDIMVFEDKDVAEEELRFVEILLEGKNRPKVEYSHVTLAAESHGNVTEAALKDINDPATIKLAHSLLSAKMLNLQVIAQLLYITMDLAGLAIAVLWAFVAGMRGSDGVTEHYVMATSIIIIAGQFLIKLLIGRSWVHVMPAVVRNSLDSVCQRNGVVFCSEGGEWRQLLWVTSMFDSRRDKWCKHLGLGVQYSLAVTSFTDAHEAANAVQAAVSTTVGIYIFILVVAITLCTIIDTTLFPSRSSLITMSVSIATLVAA